MTNALVRFLAVLLFFACASCATVMDLGPNPPSPPSPAQTTEHRYLLINFTSTPSPDDGRLLLSEGVVLLNRLTDTSYLASIPPELIIRSDGAETLRVDGWQLTLEALDSQAKLQRAIAANQPPPWAVTPDNKVKVLVKVYNNVSTDRASSGLGKYDPKVHRYGFVIWSLQIDKAEAQRVVYDIAELEWVESLEYGPIPLVLLNDTARTLILSETVQSADLNVTPPTYALSGKSSGEDEVRLGIIDIAIQEAHPDFADSNGTRFFVSNSSSYNDHGTAVASIAAGNSGWTVGTHHAHRGHAPEARLGEFSAASAILTPFNVIKSTVEVWQTDVTNHSYEMATAGAYSALASIADLAVRGAPGVQNGNIPRRPQIWAGGNTSGYGKITATAKNVISVGSVDSLRCNGRNCAFTGRGRGPTTDGRLKPEVVAPGCRNVTTSQGIVTALSLNGHGSNTCFTSFAAPVVTGIIALLLEEIGKPSIGLSNFDNASTYKAVLVQTADDQWDTTIQSPYGVGPDFTTGYGLVNAKQAVSLVAEKRWREATVTYQGQREVFCLKVVPGESVQVTLAWDDQEGPSLIRDLDLRVYAPDNSVHEPWLPNSPSATPQAPATTGNDATNNLEVVAVAGQQSSTDEPALWRVEVTGTVIPLQSVQPYSLAASHEILDSCGNMKIHPFQKAPLPADRLTLRNPILLDDLCRYVINCPICRNDTMQYCPAWKLVVGGLPEDARIVLMTGDGTTVSESTEVQNDTLLPIPERSHGERHFIAALTNNGTLHEGSFFPTFRPHLIRRWLWQR